MAKKNEQKQTYTVLARLRHDGDRYKPGDEIDLTETEARPLLRSSAVALPGGDAAAAALLQQQSGELEERVKSDLEAAQAARDEAAKDLEAAKKEREAAAADLEAAKQERAAAEKALDEAKKAAAKGGKSGGEKTSQK